MENEWSILKNDLDISSRLGSYGLLILNTPLLVSPTALFTLWKNASWRITVDGGTDRWLRLASEESQTVAPPDQVTGDFDSISPQTLDRCKQTEGVQVIHTPDQDYTDFDKALAVLQKSCKAHLDCFVAVNELGGRLDQTFSVLNTLSRTDLPGYLLSSDSLTWLLKPGSHRIHIPPVLLSLQPTPACAVLPFRSATVTSSGLKWNLCGTKIEFGGMISSSNTYDGSPEVVIQTDETIIWTMSLGGQLT